MKHVTLLICSMLFCSSVLSMDLQQDSGKQRLLATSYAVVRSYDEQTLAFLERRRAERDAADDCTITLRIAIHTEKERLKERVEKYKNIYNGDAVKTWQAMCSLLAFPSFQLKPTERHSDIQLMHALGKGDIEAAQAAFKKKANPNCYAGDGNTMLIFVLMKNRRKVRYDLAKLLLDQRAYPNMPALNSTTPLHCVVSLYQDESHNRTHDNGVNALALIELLVAHGARMKVSGYDPWIQESVSVDLKATPLSLFQPNCVHNVEILLLLLTHVYPEDICLGGDAQTITNQIIARNELLLRMSPINPDMVQSARSNEEDLLILNLLNPKAYREEFGALIAGNVAKMMQNACTKKDSAPL